MSEQPQFPTLEDQARERELETGLFGKPVEKNSILEEIYVYLFLEDIEQIQIDFDLRATEFNSVETPGQWNDLAPELSKLRGYKSKRNALGVNIGKIRELKVELRPTIDILKKKLRAIGVL